MSKEAHIHFVLQQLLLGEDAAKRGFQEGTILFWDKKNPNLLVAIAHAGMTFDDIVDCRQKAPFFSFSPCPWCGVHNDKDHDPLLHVNPKLGVPNEPVADPPSWESITPVDIFADLTSEQRKNFWKTNGTDG